MKRRNTKHKQAIMEAFQKHHLLSASELAGLIGGADPSTIYRNLKRLEKDGVLRSVQLDAATKYELVEEHGEHDHFVCDGCKTVSSIFINEDSIKSEIPTDGDFSVTVRGMCPECS